MAAPMLIELGEGGERRFSNLAMGFAEDFNAIDLFFVLDAAKAEFRFLVRLPVETGVEVIGRYTSCERRRGHVSLEASPRRLAR